MVRKSTNLVALLASVTFAVWAFRAGGSVGSSTTFPVLVPDDAPRYTSGGQLVFPARYREWPFLTSGLDMSYAKDAPSGNMHMFENVFVDLASYKAFQKTGTWRDKSTLLIEYRNASQAVSINKAGRVQTDEAMGYLAHVKDERRFPGTWRFFSFGADRKPGLMLPTTTACYTCHSAHAAVDTTFVQFYPTLLPIAKAKGTLQAAYIRESATPATKAH